MMVCEVAYYDISLKSLISVFLLLDSLLLEMLSIFRVFVDRDYL